MNFSEKLAIAIARNQSILCLGLDPNPEVMPLDYQAQDDDPAHTQAIDHLWHWIEHIIETTVDLVCAYKPTLGFYTAFESAGIDLLLKTLAAIPSHIPIILDAKHADLNSSTVMAKLVFEQWGVDAITVSPYLGQDLAARFLRYPDKAIFASCYSANVTAQAVQTYPDEKTPLYLNVIRNCQGWASYEQLGLEIGAANLDVLKQVRAVAPERLILVRSLWGSRKETVSKDLKPILEAGLDASGGGLILPVNPDALALQNPEILVRSLRDQTNKILSQVNSRTLSCQMWVPDICLLNHQPHANLILELFDLGCIQFGEYVQASGAVFPYYIDLRKIISSPQVFDAVIAAYADILEELTFDRIAGIPYGSLPTASGLALRLNRPLIFPRKEVKAYGARRLVEGNYTAGETAVVVDDILISGKSAMEGAEKLKSCGLQVRDIVVFLDHGGNVCQTLAQNGYAAHAVLTLSEINDILYDAGRINESQFHMLSHNSVVAKN